MAANTSQLCPKGECAARLLRLVLRSVIHPRRTLVHIEADFKKRTNKDDSGNYTEQTLLLLGESKIRAGKHVSYGC